MTARAAAPVRPMAKQQRVVFASFHRVRVASFKAGSIAIVVGAIGKNARGEGDRTAVGRPLLVIDARRKSGELLRIAAGRGDDVNFHDAATIGEKREAR